MTKIWCAVRKKWVENTPEEQVRQFLIQLLSTDYGYPLSRMAVEKQVPQAPKKLRFDLVIYDTLGKPQLLVECKAPSVKLNDDTLDQISRYNSYIHAPYLLLSNGLTHVCIKTSMSHFERLDTIPTFSCLEKRLLHD